MINKANIIKVLIALFIISFFVPTTGYIHSTEKLGLVRPYKKITTFQENVWGFRVNEQISIINI